MTERVGWEEGQVVKVNSERKRADDGEILFSC